MGDRENWLISYYEQRYKGRPNAHWKLLYGTDFEGTRKNVTKCFRVLETLIPEDWHDAVSDQSSDKSDGDGDDRSLHEGSDNSLSGTQQTQRTTLAASDGRASTAPRSEAGSDDEYVTV